MVVAPAPASAAPLPSWHRGEVVVPPPERDLGWWAGAPSAVLADGGYYLAYRLRRPLGEGRGYANVVAWSPDGVRVETVASVDKDAFGAESLERPALTRTPDGRWRLYVSCATPGTKHWRVDVLEAATPSGLAAATPRTVLPGDRDTAVKDPTLLWSGGRWHMWASVHPLDDPAATDRMRTEYATSDDGLRWDWHGTVLAGRPGSWDARGVRISAVLDGPVPVAYYDGRATAGENWEERTGTASGVLAGDRYGAFSAIGDRPAATSPYRTGGLRYVTALRLPDGAVRLYYEGTRDDGAHELRTELVSPS